VFEKLAAEEKEHLGKLEARYRELVASDPTLESQPTFLFFKGAANGLFAAGTDELNKGVDDRGRCSSASLRARLAQVLQALRRALRGIRGQADLSRVCRRRARPPRLLIREYKNLVARQGRRPRDGRRRRSA
jgi:hypothetical protein